MNMPECAAKSSGPTILGVKELISAHLAKVCGGDGGADIGLLVVRVLEQELRDGVPLPSVKAGTFSRLQKAFETQANLLAGADPLHARLLIEAATVARAMSGAGVLHGSVRRDSPY